MNAHLYLWRTVACIRNRDDQPEVHVFFEGPLHRVAAIALLDTLLPVVWGVAPHEIETYNLTSEAELQLQACGDSSTGDARLLEVGFGPEGPYYADPARVQLFVRPAMHARLTAALNSAALLSISGQPA